MAVTPPPLLPRTGADVIKNLSPLATLIIGFERRINAEA